MAGDRRALCLVAGAILLCSCFSRAQCGDGQEQEREIQRLRSKVASLGELPAGLSTAGYKLFRVFLLWWAKKELTAEHTWLGSEDEVGWRKEETSQLESVVRERTAQIVALVSGLEAMQVRNVADDESVVKASTNSAMIEKQVRKWTINSSLQFQQVAR